MRSRLTRAGLDSEGAALFVALYRSWCHSAGALLSLCLLAQARSPQSHTRMEGDQVRMVTL